MTSLKQLKVDHEDAAGVRLVQVVVVAEAAPVVVDEGVEEVGDPAEHL